MAKISHGKKPREILFIDQLLIYLSLFPVACSDFDVAGLLKYGDHQGRIGRAEIGICKPQRRAAAFILPLEILSADAERRSGIRIAGLGVEPKRIGLLDRCDGRTADKRKHQNKG